MARKMSAQELRYEAKKLMEKARKMKEKNLITIGGKTLTLAQDGNIKGELLDEIEKLFGKLSINQKKS